MRTAWTLLHKVRRAMVRPGRDLLTGRVEVDECYIGGLEESLPGRLNLDKALIVVAAQEDGPGIGRIRMRQNVDASAASLVPFVQDSLEPGSVIHADGWLGYLPVESKGYQHEVRASRPSVSPFHPDIFFLSLPRFTPAIDSSLHSPPIPSPPALATPANFYTPHSPHSICISPASAAPAASF